MPHSPETLSQAFSFLRNNSRLAREFAEQGFKKKLPVRTTIYSEGDHCSQIAFILSGELRVYKAHDSGRQVTLYELTAGDTCILNASCILSHIGYPANATCITETEALLLPAPIFKKLILAYPELQNFVHSLLSYRLTEIMTLVEEVLFNKLDKRLFDYLVERSENGIVSLTHQSIANDLGTSREVVSRLLKDLQLKNTIRYGRNRIEILDYKHDQ